MTTLPSTATSSLALTPQAPQPQTKGERKAEAAQNIQVYVRCRPLNVDEMSVSHSASVVDCSGGVNRVNVHKSHKSTGPRTFHFDRVFGERSTQADVYKRVVHPLVDQMLEGYNCTVFAYGQTGTGKTYTMGGDKDSKTHAGIVPRALMEIFDYREKHGLLGDKTFQIKVSFLELYNEDIIDLLTDGDPTNCKLYEDKRGSVKVVGQEERVVETKEQVFDILTEGSRKRKTAGTKMNANSSRSHTIFTIAVHNPIMGQDKLNHGKINLVDLAGSENIGKSGAVKMQAKEAGKINKSLLTLGVVINSLVEGKNHIPYRESKLTRLLQDSLGGRTKTSIIATISPANIHVEETLSTLSYASNAKNIKNRPELNQKISTASQLSEFSDEIHRLKRELADQRQQDGGVFMSVETKENLELGQAQLVHVRKELKELSTLFELKTSEAESLQTLVDDVNRQLDENRIVLRQTQAEKEEQEHLVHKHAQTEQKIRDQAIGFKEMSDQQQHDLQKVHDSRDRKSRLEDSNMNALSSHLNKLPQLVGSMDKRTEDVQGDVRKHCDDVDTAMEKQQRNQEQERGQIREIIIKGNEEKQTKLSELGSLHSSDDQQDLRFLSERLSKHQTGMNQRTLHAQNVLKDRLAGRQERRVKSQKKEQAEKKAATMREQGLNKYEQKQQDNVEKHSNLVSTYSSTTLEEMREAEEQHEKTMQELEKEAQDVAEMEQEMEQTQAEFQELDNKVEELVLQKSEVKKKLQSLQSKFKERQHKLSSRMKQQLLERKLLQQLETKVQQLAVTSDKLSEETKADLTEGRQRLLADDEIHMKEQHEWFKQEHADLQRDDEQDKAVAEKGQEMEAAAYADMELKFRAKSDDVAARQKVKQELIREIASIGTEQGFSFEKVSESSRLSSSRKLSEDKEQQAAFCAKFSQDTKELRSLFEETLQINTNLESALRRDAPTGETPARRPVRTLDDIVLGTPDDQRLGRFRRTRDIGVAMKLKIDDLDDEDLNEEDADADADTDVSKESDSVFSASTNVTESEASVVSRAKATRAGGDRNYSRQNSRETAKGPQTPLKGSMSNLSQASTESEEVGYGSDMENKAPTFARPGSKLVRPKVFSSTSTTTSTTARSRSSSRTRNPLSSSN